MERPTLDPQRTAIAAALLAVYAAAALVGGPWVAFLAVTTGVGMWWMWPILPHPVPSTAPAAQQPPAPRLGNEDDLRVIRGVFASLKIDAHITGRVCGPSVTRYEITPGTGTRVAKLEGVASDLQLALRAESVRVLSPVAGKTAVGFEIPNGSRRDVPLAGLLASRAMQPGCHPLSLALGQDTDGRNLVALLPRTRHILVGGATGSGKSYFLHAVLVSILHSATPSQVKLLLIDPKRVEFAAYAAVPHLVTPVVVDQKKAEQALNWVSGEIDRRYEMLEQAGVRDIEQHNADGRTPLAYLVVVVDELERLLDQQEAIENAVAKGGAVGRAAGVYFILATQRPAAEVVTGQIKANIPTRVAFATASLTDSRVVLDTPGAEKLLGSGDGLFRPSGIPPIRFQGALASDGDIKTAVDKWSGQKPKYLFGTAATPNPAGTKDALEAAAWIVLRDGGGSVAKVQRGLKIRRAVASALLAQLEDLEILGESRGAEPRELLVNEEQLRRILEARK